MKKSVQCEHCKSFVHVHCYTPQSCPKCAREKKENDYPPVKEKERDSTLGIKEKEKMKRSRVDSIEEFIAMNKKSTTPPKQQPRFNFISNYSNNNLNSNNSNNDNGIFTTNNSPQHPLSSQKK